MLDVFFGDKTPEEVGFKEAPYLPQGGYPYRPNQEGDTTVYDLSPYMQKHYSTEHAEDLHYFSKTPEALIDTLNALKPGESHGMGGHYDEDPNFYSGYSTSIDLGQYVHGFGRDDKGKLYYSVADIFDTGGTFLGDALEEGIGDAHPINLYARYYLDKKPEEIIRYKDW